MSADVLRHAARGTTGVAECPRTAARRRTATVVRGRVPGLDGVVGCRFCTPRGACGGRSAGPQDRPADACGDRSRRGRRPAPEDHRDAARDRCARSRSPGDHGPDLRADAAVDECRRRDDPDAGRRGVRAPRRNGFVSHIVGARLGFEGTFSGSVYAPTAGDLPRHPSARRPLARRARHRVADRRPAAPRRHDRRPAARSSPGRRTPSPTRT